MEIWDAYNKEFEKIEGMTLIRGEAIPDGVYHLVSDVIVRHADGTYLFYAERQQKALRRHVGSNSRRFRSDKRRSPCLCH